MGERERERSSKERSGGRIYRKGEKKRERKRENAAHLEPFVTETRREPAARAVNGCGIRRFKETGAGPIRHRVVFPGKPNR